MRGRSFSRQVRLRQIRRRATQDLILLLEQSDPLQSLAQLGILARGGSGLDAVLDVGGLHPVRQEGLADWRSRRRSAPAADLARCGPRGRRRHGFQGIRLRTECILPAAPPGTTDQMLPIRAAVPLLAN